MKTKRYEKCNKQWTKSVVYRILTNEVYIGTIVSHKSYKANHKVKKRIVTSKSDRIYVENMHQSLVSKKVFYDVQEKLKDGSKWRDRENYHPFKKMMYCGVCGAKATMKTHKRKVKSGEIHCHQYFVCRTKSDKWHNCDNGTVRASIITQTVQDKVKEECSKIVFSKGDITSIYEQAKQNSNNKKVLIKKEIEKYEKEVKELEKKVSQIYEDKLEGIIKQEDFSKFYNKFQNKKEKYINEINKLKIDLENEETKKVVSYSHIKKLADKWLNSDELDEELIQRLIERIEFKGRNINIKYKFMKQ